MTNYEKMYYCLGIITGNCVCAIALVALSVALKLK